MNSAYPSPPAPGDARVFGDVDFVCDENAPEHYESSVARSHWYRAFRNDEVVVRSRHWSVVVYVSLGLAPVDAAGLSAVSHYKCLELARLKHWEDPETHEAREVLGGLVTGAWRVTLCFDHHERVELDEDGHVLERFWNFPVAETRRLPAWWDEPAPWEPRRPEVGEATRYGQAIITCTEDPAGGAPVYCASAASSPASVIARSKVWPLVMRAFGILPRTMAGCEELRKHGGVRALANAETWHDPESGRDREITDFVLVNMWQAQLTFRNGEVVHVAEHGRVFHRTPPPRRPDPVLPPPPRPSVAPGAQASLF